MLWLLLLPVKLAFGILFALLALPFAIAMLPIALVLAPVALVLWLPFALLRFTLKLIVLPIALVFAFVGLAFGAIALVGALLIPLVPLLLLVGAGWVLWRLASGPTGVYPSF
jgi:hypothetical protein